MRMPVVGIISAGHSVGDRGNGIVYWKGKSRNMTKKEVLEMLHDRIALQKDSKIEPTDSQ